MRDSRSPEDAGTPIVFVVDDDRSVRKALLRLLKSHGFEAEGFESANDYLVRTPVGVAGCLLLDMEMPELSGLELQRELVERGDAPAIVFLTGHGTVPKSVRAMKGGAVDFLEKPFEEQDLLAAVGRALEADRRVRRERAGLAALEAKHSTLTPREREVFDLVASGLLNKQVGARLGTSEKTVKVHRGRVMRKMEATCLAELVLMRERLGSGESPRRT